MWPPGKYEPNNQAEATGLLPQRKRAVDLVRQAQFAACSYLGFDPYDENYNHSFRPQVPISDPSGTMEFHLHHHHHHHYAENSEILKDPSHMPASTSEIPSGVGSLFSICNQNPVLQADARIGYRQVDEEMQRKTSNGLWMKSKSYQDQDMDFARFDTRLSLKKDNVERIKDNNIFGAENGWSVPQPGVYQATAADDLQHTAGASYSHATYSTGHWECSVVREGNLARSLNIKVEQATEKRNMSTSTETNELLAEKSFGWGPTSKYYSSSHLSPTHSSSTLERSPSPQSRDSNFTSGVYDFSTDTSRRFGASVSKRKKTNTDHLNKNEIHHAFPNMGAQHSLDSGKGYHIASAIKLNQNTMQDGASVCKDSAQPLKHSVLMNHDFVASEKNSTHVVQGNCANGTEMTCGQVAKAVDLRSQRSYPSYEDCKCQQLLPLQLSAKCQGNQEGLRFQMTVDLVKDKDSTYPCRQEMLREKIITLDVIEERSAQSISRDVLVDGTTKASIVKQDPATAGDSIHGTRSSTCYLHREKECILDVEMQNMFNGSFQKVEETPMNNVASGQLMCQLARVAAKKNVEEDISMGCHAGNAQSSDLEYKAAGKLKRHQDVGIHIVIEDEGRGQLNELTQAIKGEIFEAQSTEHHTSALRSRRAERCENQQQQLLTEVNAFDNCTDIIQDRQEGPPHTSAKTVINPQGAVSQSYSGDQRVTQLLEMEKDTNNFSKKELKEAKTNFQEFLTDLGLNRHMQQPSLIKDSLSQTVALLQDRERKGLRKEFEARLAAEEKIRISEVPKEAAGGRFICLLDERAGLHTKASEELKQKDVGTLRSQNFFQENMKDETTDDKILEEEESFVTLNKSSKAKTSSTKETYETGFSPDLFTTGKNAKMQEELDKFEKPKTGRENSETKPLGNVASNQESQCIEVSRFFEKTGGSFQRKGNSSISRHKDAELLKLVKKQQLQLKSAENALEDLEKRLEDLEIDKGTLQERLKRMQSDRELKGLEKAVQTACNQVVFESYDCVYQSPIFEEWKANEGVAAERKEDTTITTDQKSQSERILACIIDKSKEDEKDLEIQQLKEELKNLRAEMMSHKEKHKGLCSAEQQLCSAAVTESKYLKIYLDIAKRQIAEEETTNKMLREKLEERCNHLNEILAKHAKELQRTENTSSQTHQMNLQLVNDLANTETRLLELQKRHDGLLETVDSQWKEAKLNAETLKATIDELRHKLSTSESGALELKTSAENKDSQLREYKRSMQALLTEKDAIAKEKVGLMSNLHEAKKEAEDQKLRATEYRSINEELLEFAQRKENEVTGLNQQIQSLQQQIFEKSSENAKLRPDLEERERDKEMSKMRKSYHSLQLECKNLKSRLAESDHHLVQHEGTIGKLTKQVTDIMQGRDSMLEEAAQFHGYLQNAKYREFELEKELRDSKLTSKNFEDKLETVELEVFRMQSELAEVKKQNSLMHRVAEEKRQETLEMRKEAEELRKKVQDLEEEVMEKEGQIAILKSSFPEEFESGF